MKQVDLPLAQMSYPMSCCRCGSPEADVRSYSEHIALRALVPLRVSIRVPVCKKCARRKSVLYLAGIVLFALSMAAVRVKLAYDMALAGGFALILLGAALALFALAARSTPIKILDYLPRSGRIVLGVLHQPFANALAEQSGGTVAEYQPVRKRFALVASAILVLVVMAMALGY